MSRVVMIIASSLLAILFSWNLYLLNYTPKAGFVRIEDVFSGFELKKELEKKFIHVKEEREKVLDSLSLILEIESRRLQTTKNSAAHEIQLLNKKREEFMIQKQRIEEDNIALGEKYDREIITQMNQYIQEFGQVHKYTYIFGNGNSGSVVYAEDSKDLTKEVIEFINGKYKGL